MQDNIKRFKKSVASHGFAQLVTIFTQVAGLPIFLSHWTVEEYGSWLLLTAIPLYLALMDFGIAAAAGNSMTMLRSANKNYEANILCVQLIKVMSVVCASGLLFIFLIFICDKFFEILHFKNKEVFLLLISLSVVTIFCGTYDAIYRSYSKYALITMHLTATRLYEWGLCMIFVMADKGLIGAAFGLFLGRLLGMSIIQIDISKKFHDINWKFFPKIKVDYVNFFRGGVQFILFPAGNLVFIQGGVILCGTIFGNEVLATFNTLRTLSRFVTQISVLSSKSIQPEIANLCGKGEYSNVNKILEKISKKIIIIGLTMASILFLLGGFVVNFWTKNKVAYDSRLMGILLLAAIISGAWQFKSSVLMAVNKGEFLSVSFLLISLLFLLCAYALGKLLGVQGIAVAYVICELIKVYLVG